MPDIRTRQASHNVEANGDLGASNRRPPTTFGVQQLSHILERANVAVKVPGHATVVHEPSDSRLLTLPVSLASGCPVVSIPPVIVQGPLLPSQSGPARGEYSEQSQFNEESIESTSSADDQLALPTSTQPQRTDTSLQGHPSRFAQAFGHMTLLFGTVVSSAKLIIVIRAGDTLVRSDAVPFLTDQLPLWKGMWQKSSLLMPSRNDSITDYFVKVSRCIACMNERSTLNRIRVLLHRVLQYQFYLRFLDEAKQRVQGPGVKRKRGIRDAAHALNHLLEELYIDDWGLIGPAEKQRRRNLLHKQKHLGKRLMTLSSCMGYGILLLGSPEAMGHM